jgi:hypothetical protein
LQLELSGLGTVTFEQVNASLGSLLLLWSAIERAARKEVTRAHGGVLPKSAHGIAAALNAWESSVITGRPAEHMRVLLATTLRAQLHEPLTIRNGVCHGLVGISSEHDGKPASLSWEINDLKRSITWHELQISFRWLSKVPSAISMISTSPLKGLGSRMTDTDENRAWWFSEYRIELREPGSIGP